MGPQDRWTRARVDYHSLQYAGAGCAEEALFGGSWRRVDTNGVSNWAVQKLITHSSLGTNSDSAWTKITTHPRFTELTFEDFDFLARELSEKVECHGYGGLLLWFVHWRIFFLLIEYCGVIFRFGAVIEEFEVDDILEALFLRRGTRWPLCLSVIWQANGKEFFGLLFYIIFLLGDGAVIIIIIIIIVKLFVYPSLLRVTTICSCVA